MRAPRLRPSVWSAAGSEIAALLRDGPFRRVWLTGLLAGVVRWLEMLAIGVFVFQTTGSPSTAALMTFMRMAPMLLLGLFAGAIADRFERKSLLLGGLAGLCVVSLLLTGLALTGSLRLWHIALGAFLGGVFWSTEFPVRRTMIGEIAGPARVGAAMGLESATSNATRMLGPLLGGLLLQLAGLHGAYLLSALLYGLAAALVLRLDYRSESTGPRDARIFANMLDGLVYACRNRMVLATLLVTAIVNLWGFAYVALVPVIGEEQLGLSAVLIGVLMSAEGLGALLGALAVGGFGRQRDYARIYVGFSFLFLVMILIFALSRSFPLSLAALFVSGVGIAGFAVMQSTIMFLVAPPAMRSRLMGVLTVTIGTGPIGMLYAGFLADWVGAGTAVAVVATQGIVALWITSWIWPELWRADSVRAAERAQEAGGTSSRTAMPSSPGEGAG